MLNLSAAQLIGRDLACFCARPAGGWNGSPCQQALRSGHEWREDEALFQPPAAASFRWRFAVAAGRAALPVVLVFQGHDGTQVAGRTTAVAGADRSPDRPVQPQRFRAALQAEPARNERDHKHLALLFIDRIISNRSTTRLATMPAMLLQGVAQALKASVRANDTIARLGGDEFTAVLEGLDTSRIAAAMIARKILAALRQPFPPERQRYGYPGQRQHRHRHASGLR